MTEIFENKEKEILDRKFRDFDSLHEDNWHELVSVGVPLFTELSEAGDGRAESVRNTLEYTKRVIENSGSTNSSTLIERINTIL